MLKGLKKQNLPIKKKYIIAIAAFIIVGLIPSYYFYAQYQGAQERLANPTKAAETQSKELVSKVGKLIELPTDENPTIATVSDATKLSGQMFFAKAQNGDKVLIYGNAQKAFLYRPSINKLINVGPINVNESGNASPSQDSQGSSGPTSTPVPTKEVVKTPRILILNGTTTVGLTKRAENALKEESISFELVDKDNSKEKYDNVIVVDLSGKNKDAAASIAKVLGGAVGSLPSEEDKPKDTDILIILGKSFVN